jgi:hypothetical protein
MAIDFEQASQVVAEAFRTEANKPETSQENRALFTTMAYMVTDQGIASDIKELLGNIDRVASAHGIKPGELTLMISETEAMTISDRITQRIRNQMIEEGLSQIETAMGAFLAVLSARKKPALFFSCEGWPAPLSLVTDWPSCS